MTPSNGHPTRDELELRANLARERLAATLSALDVRRHQSTDVGHQLRHHLRPLVVIGAGVLLVVGSSIAAGVVAARRRREQRMRARWDAVRRLWDHPERVATHSPERPFGLQLLQNLGTTLATVALGQAVRRASR